MTGIGPVSVKVPRVRDRKPGEDKITFTPSILPRYLRKAKSVESTFATVRHRTKRTKGCLGRKTGLAGHLFALQPTDLGQQGQHCGGRDCTNPGH